MGGNYSSLPTASPNFPYFTLSFRTTDTIKLCFADDAIISVVTQAVSKYWASGIQSFGTREDGSYEIKFRGRPFLVGGYTEAAIQIKEVCCELLENLYAQGWQLVVTSDLSRTVDFSTLFFHRCTVENRRQRMVCVSLSRADSLQLVNAPQTLAAALKSCVLRAYDTGIQEEKFIGSVYQVKLRGVPWFGSNVTDNVCGRTLLLEIIRNFDQNGFRFYGTINFKGTADCLFFTDKTDNPKEAQCQYMMISLNSNDRLRLIDCPTTVIDATRETIRHDWCHGLQGEKELIGAYEFKLGGTPWWASGVDTVSSRYFITMLIQKLLCLGWCMVSSLDVSRRVNDKSVFVFKSSTPTVLSHFCISLNETDKIRLINAPKNMVDIVRNVISTSWPYGIKNEKTYGESYQFCLNGCAWEVRIGNEDLAARCMMCILLKTLLEHGFRVVCSADVSAKYTQSGDDGPVYPLDVHSWFVACVGHDNQLGPSNRTSLVVPHNPISQPTSSRSIPPSHCNTPTLPTYSELFGPT